MTSASVRREFNPRPPQSGTWIGMKGRHFVPRRQAGIGGVGWGDYLCHWCQSCLLEGLFTLMGGVFGDSCSYSVDPRGVNSSLRPPLRGQNVRSVVLPCPRRWKDPLSSSMSGKECVRPSVSPFSLKEFIVSACACGWCSVCYRWLTV